MFTFTKKIITNLPGWRTNRKIVVFESDDWGSIRMPSKEVYEKLSAEDIDLNDGYGYNKYDSLETSEDLEALFEILTKYKDKNNNYPVITANCLVANPDFDKIRSENFERYSYETVDITFSKTNGCERTFDLWHEGRKKGLFYPQFHGREHLNVPRWMNALQTGHKETRTAFEHGVWGHNSSFNSGNRKHFLAGFDYVNEEQRKEVYAIAEDGIKLFENLLGYKSDSFIAPNFVWDVNIEEILSKYGVKFIQGQRKQLVPLNRKKNFKPVAHYIGQRNKNGQIYLIRNAYFEPSSNKNLDWIDNCLKEIKMAFTFKKPAVISVHRLNFIGSIVKTNRDENLRLFDELLSRILSNWSEVEFMSTPQLGNLILESNY